jgi:hypothetical protein
MVVLVCGFSFFMAGATPFGAVIVGTPEVDTGPVRIPAFRNDSGGRIITTVLSVEQQDLNWKAYVGNVSGLFVLQNVDNQSIYEWPSVSVATGKLFISRNSSVNFSSVGCANNSQIVSEQLLLGFGNTDADNINNTFIAKAHRQFDVGSVPIALNNCSSIATWVNDTTQAAGATAAFQEVLLFDGSTLVYASLLNDNKQGYDNSSYDFQAIIAENGSSSLATTYYFYVELDST